VRAYYHTVFRPDLTTLVIIGKVTPQAAAAEVERCFGGWRAAGPAPATDLPAAPPNRAQVVTVPNASRVQDRVTLAQTLALTRSDPDFYPLELGNAVLGGSFYSTRLSIDLRRNAGLVYSVDSSLQAGRTRGAYFIEYASDPQNVGKASDAVVRELTAMQETPVGSDELTRVKAYLLRQIPLAESGVAQIALGVLGRRELDLPLDEPRNAAQHYIDLDGTAVQAAFRKWLRPADLVRITEGPAAQ